jgi:hypothetical protein
MDSNRFVEVAHEIASRLDFAVEIPDPRLPLKDRVRILECLWWDYRASMAESGRAGAGRFKVVTEVRDQLAAVVDAHDQHGNLEPWNRSRDRVLDLLATIRASCGPEAGDSPPPRPASATGGVCHQDERLAGRVGKKGEEGEKVLGEQSAPPRSLNGRRILSLLLEHGATQEADHLTREYIIDESRLSLEKVRRAIENDLRPLGLVESKRGRGGGLWLSNRGIEIAGKLAAK